MDSFTTHFTVAQTPETVFNAINNVRGWWSQEVAGTTDAPDGEFTYHYRDVHRAAFKITAFEPNHKVVWHVVDNYFNFVKDKSEWKGTDIVFEVIPQGEQTEVRFTHVGLVPAYECYEVCTSAWGTYITSSLRNLITSGEGQPNPLEDVVNKAEAMSTQSFTTSFLVEESPEAVFEAVNNVRGWWSDNVEGSTDALGGTFGFHHEDAHHSTQQIRELVPGQKVVWHVSDSQINFVEQKDEWTGTDIVFEIEPKNGQTELKFTHVGLVPTIQCYGDCADAWGFYINQSLRNLITSGEGKPAQKEAAEREV